MSINSCFVVNLVNCYANEMEVLEYAAMLTKQDVAERIYLIININLFSDGWNKVRLLKALEGLAIKSYVVDACKNLGYLNGMLNGYKEFKQHEPDIMIKWVIMSNTDIEIQSETFISDLFIKEYPEKVACIGPSIYQLQSKSYGNPQYMKRHTKEKLDILLFVLKFSYLAKIYFYLSYLKSLFRKKEKPESCFIEEAHGCFFIISEKIIIEMLKRPFPCLMYSEEAYISEIIRLLGYKEYYDSELEVTHKEKKVTGKLKTSVKVHMMRESVMFIRNMYYDSQRKQF